MLDGSGVDLVDAGRQHEAPAMQGEARDGRTPPARPVEFARDIRAAARMPWLNMGGIRWRPVAEQVLASGGHGFGTGTAL